MTEIERKALALIAEIKEERGMPAPDYLSARAALIRAIEQHEAFRQEVSDAVVNLNRYWEHCEPAKEDFYARFDRFIIPKPVDPLVEKSREWAIVVREADKQWSQPLSTLLEQLAAALAAMQEAKP